MKLTLETYGNATGDDFHVDTSKEDSVRVTLPNGRWFVVEIYAQYEDDYNGN